MCVICDDFGLDLSKYEDKVALLNAIKRINKEHKWYMLVGPMSDSERVWYDLQSPLRKG